MIFLTGNLRSQNSKRLILLLGFVFLILFVQAQTGVVNNGAKMLVNSGAILKITGTGADYTNTTTGGTDGKIDLDGKIELQGNWINNAVSGNVLINETDGNGEVVFNGSSSQNISGLRASYFEKLTLNNNSGLNLDTNVQVISNLLLTNGIVTLNDNDLTIGLSGTISGGTFGTSKMILVNGSGSLVKSINAAGSFTFPIGENTGTIEYSPVDFTLNSHAGASSSWVSAHVTDAKHTSNNSPSEFLSRYWTLTSSGINTPNYNADFHYLPSDINGVELSIYSAEYDDGLNRSVYSTVDDAHNILSVTGLSSIENTFADYTGVDGTVPTVDITCGVSNPTNDNPIPFTATFSEAVSGFAFTDITIDNGSTAAVSTSDNTIFTFNVVPDADGELTIDINAGVCTDIAGNDNVAATQFAILYDGTKPNVNLTTTANNPTNLSPFTVKVQFTEKVSGFVLGDISVTNGAAGNLQLIETESVWTVDITPGGDGTVNVDINAGVAVDAAGNTNIAATTLSVTYDGTVPTVSIASSESSPTNANPIPITITFSELVTGFALSDINVGNGIAGALTNITPGKVWTAEITPTNTAVTVDIAANTVIDAAGNNNTAATQFAITYDGTKPNVEISTTEPKDPTNTSPIPFKITFNENVSNFIEGDITVVNGTTSNYTNTIPGQVWTVDITPTVSGLLKVDVAGGVAIDAAGNNNTAATTFSITFDNTDPTATYTPADNATDVSITSNLDINFSEVVNAKGDNIRLYKTTGDVLVETFNVLTQVSGSGTSTISINPASNLESAIDYYVEIDASAFDDEAGNSFAGIANNTIWNFTSTDVNNPYITATTPADNASDVVIGNDMEITFSEIVDAGTGNISLYKVGVGTPIETFDVTTDITGDGTTTITFDPTAELEGETDYYLLIDATAFKDQNATPNYFPGISDSETWNFTSEDVTDPIISLLSPVDGAINVVINDNLQITFSEIVDAGTGNISLYKVGVGTPIETFDVTTDITGDGTTTITFDPTAELEGETDYYVLIDATAFDDEAGNSFAGIAVNTAWNFTSEDVADPTVVVSTTETSPTNTSPFEVTITFNEEVQNFEVGDISVTDGTVDNLLTSDNITYTVDITPDGELNVSIEVIAGQAQDLAGNENEASNVINVVYDNTSPTVEITSTQSGTINTDLDITITFSEGISSFTTGNITVPNGTVTNLTNTVPSTSTTWTATINSMTDGVVTVDILVNAVTDTAGNGNIASNQFTIDYDGSAPTISVLSPTDDSTDVAVTNNLKITFDEKVISGTGYVVIYKTVGDVLVEQIPVVNVSGLGTKTITIDPVSDLESEVEYYVLIDAGAFTDLVGNDFVGISSTTDWSFTAADVTAPFVNTFSPADNATNVLVNSNLVMTFNENVIANIGNITIKNADTGMEHEVIDVTTVSVVGNTVTINPTIDFIGQTNYYVLIDESSFKDGSGNYCGGINTDTQWNFFTEDKNAPLITAFLPPDNSNGVSVASNFEITFDENIVANTGNITIMQETPLSIQETIAIGSSNVTISNNTVTIDPTTNLEGYTNYYILIDSAAVKDVLGNAYSGITDENEWNFITANASAPIISTLTPDDNETEVALSSNLVINFNEIVTANIGNVTIYDNNTDSIYEQIDVITGQVTVNSNVVTINPSIDFNEKTDYYVLIDSAAFQDVEANAFGGIIGTTSWNFTSEDITDPIATSFSPLDGASNISVIANLEVTFSENIYANIGNVTIMNATLGTVHETIDITSGEILISGNLLTINPSTDFIASNDYYVLIDNTAIRDFSGNNYAGISNTADWNFTTVDAADPTVTALSPLDNTIGVNITTNLQITFSETVVANTGNITIYNATTSANHEVFDVTSPQVTIATNVVTIDPDTDFDGLSNYYVLIANGAFRDVDDNDYAGMASSSDWNFTTGDVSAPIVNSYSPADGATKVSITSDLALTFNETVVVNTGNITIYDSNTDSIYEQIVVTNTEQVSISSTVVTINPPIDLVDETDYYVLVDNGAFRDTEANDFGGISDPLKWNFTTEDVTNPVIISRTPTDNATNVAIASNLVIAFDEDIFINAGNITIYDSNTDSIYEQITVPSGLVTIATNTVTINPSSDFIENTSYYVLINNDVFRDAAGNGFTGILGTTTWNFVSVDLTSPTITAIVPAKDETGVSLNSDLKITFSEPVVANTGLITIMDASSIHESISVLSTQVSIASNVVTINPGIDFNELSDYYVLIDAGAFHDESGNSFAGISDPTTWNFKTGDFTPPSVTITPAKSVNANGDFDVIVAFSEFVTGLTSDDITLGNASVGTFIESTAGLIWTVTIKPVLDGDVTIDIAAGAVTDIAGNANTAAATYTVEFDATAPTVTITSLATGTVTGNFDITVTFSEPVIGFTSGDITVANATIGTFTESTPGLIWTVTIEPIASGNVTIDIAAGVVTDIAGNNNTAAGQFGIVYDSGVGFEDIIPYEISIYSYENRVIVEFTNEGDYKFNKGVIEIYNLLGQKIVNTNIDDFHKFETELDYVSQIYLVKVVIDGTVYVKSLYIK